MRIVELSNHPRAMFEKERERLAQVRDRHWEESYRLFEEHSTRVAQANEQTQADYEARLAAHEGEVRRLRAEHDAVRGGMRWWKRFRSGARLRKAKRRPPLRPAPFAAPTPPSRLSATATLTDEEAKLAAGIEGEERVASALAQALGDEWTLLRGYRNRRGEIDLLLLGPAGLIAIEVKHRNATVYVDGDQWRFEKLDRYGNRVEEGLMADRRGRSPSQQLREPVAELEHFLAKRGQPVEIDPVVMLSHPNAHIGRADNLTATVAFDAAYIVELIGAWDTRLELERLPKIERLIVKDHRFHEDHSRR